MYQKFRLFLLLLAAACGTPEETPDPERLGYDFFPLEKGRFAVYDVFRVEYRIGARPDTQRYQLRELAVDTLTDLLHEPAFVLHRSTRRNAAQPWRLDSAWVAKRTPYTAIRKENNVDFIALSFPLKEGKTWNGNAYNAFGTDEYRVEAFDRPFVLPDTTHARTLTVVQADEDNAVLTDVRQEVYARGTGLVFKKRVQVKYEQQGGTTGGGKPESGVYYLQTLRQTGR